MNQPQRVHSMAARASSWTVANVGRYLELLDLSHLKPIFEKHQIDGSRLLQLTYQSVKKLGVSSEEDVHRILQALVSLIIPSSLLRSPSASPSHATPTPAQPRPALSPEHESKVPAVHSGGAVDSSATNRTSSTATAEQQHVHTSSTVSNRNQDSKAVAPRESASDTGGVFPVPRLFFPPMGAAPAPFDPSIMNGFRWIGSMEGWLCSHERFCENYRPGEREQTSATMGGRCCCRRLLGGRQYVLRLSVSDCACGRHRDALTVVPDTEPDSPVALLPCSMSHWLAPLVRSHAVGLLGVLGCLVHPPGGVPPFELVIFGHIDRLKQLCSGPYRWCVERFCAALKSRDKGVWVECTYPDDVKEVVGELQNALSG